MTPLKRDWLKIYSPLVDECGLMVRMNVNKKNIEMKVGGYMCWVDSVLEENSVKTSR